jgi:hypothetical protein
MLNRSRLLVEDTALKDSAQFHLPIYKYYKNRDSLPLPMTYLEDGAK